MDTEKRVIKTIPFKSKKGIGCLIVSSVFFGLIVFFALRQDPQLKSMGFTDLDLMEKFNQVTVRRDIDYMANIDDYNKTVAKFKIYGADSAGFVATLVEKEVVSVLFIGVPDGELSSSVAMLVALSILIESIDPDLPDADRQKLIKKLLKPIERGGKITTTKHGLKYWSTFNLDIGLWVSISKK